MNKNLEVVRVKDRKNLFENLSKNGFKDNVKTNQVSASVPPPKPPRTFANDPYFPIMEPNKPTPVLAKKKVSVPKLPVINYTLKLSQESVLKTEVPPPKLERTRAQGQYFPIMESDELKEQIEKLPDIDDILKLGRLSVWGTKDLAPKSNDHLPITEVGIPIQIFVNKINSETVTRQSVVKPAIAPKAPKPPPKLPKLRNNGNFGLENMDLIPLTNKTNTGKKNITELIEKFSASSKEKKELNGIEKPKYFQLSHDFEELYTKLRPKSYFGSAENLNENMKNQSSNKLNHFMAETPMDDFHLHYTLADIWNKDINFHRDQVKDQNNQKPNLSQTSVSKELVDNESDISDDKSEVEYRISRAQTIRRNNLLHYDHQETSFLKRKSPQLFEMVVLIELIKNDKSGACYTSLYKPHASLVYPKDKSGNSDRTIDSLLCLCYPDINTLSFQKSLKLNEEEQFVITLTDEAGDRKFAYCHRFFIKISPSSLPLVLCTVSPVQSTQFYQSFSREAVSRARISMTYLEFFLRDCYPKPFPAENFCLRVKDRQNQKDILLFNEKTANVADDSHLVLDTFGVEGILLMFITLLFEGRILLIGGNIMNLSKIMQSTYKLLAPFSWPHPFIPVVPGSLMDFLQLPSPYFMGLLRSCLDTKVSELFSNSADSDENDFLFIYDVDAEFVLKAGKNLPNNDSSGNKKIHKFFKISQMKTLKEKLLNIEKLPDSTSSHLKDSQITEAFSMFFYEIVGNYKQFLVHHSDGSKEFQKRKFTKSASTKAGHKFLKCFVETGMFQIWINNKLESVSSNEPQFDKIRNASKKIAKKKRLPSLSK